MGLRLEVRLGVGMNRGVDSGWDRHRRGCRMGLRLEVWLGVGMDRGMGCDCGWDWDRDGLRVRDGKGTLDERGHRMGGRNSLIRGCSRLMLHGDHLAQYAPLLDVGISAAEDAALS